MRESIPALAALAVLQGCFPPVSYFDENAIRKAAAKNKADNEQMLTEVRTSDVPADFEAKVNARMDETLKDPDSKIVEYTSRPIGSLVCGRVNAKNSYGGYTGKEPFFAYFGHDGRLLGLQIDLKADDFYGCDRVDCAFYGIKVLFQRCVTAGE